MAIRTETYELGGRQFTRTWSDANRYIVGGHPEGEYTEANDPTDLGRTYAEGREIPAEDMTEAQAVLDILLGGME